MSDPRDDYYQPWLRDKDGSLRPMTPPPADAGIAKPRESAPVGLDISAYAPPLGDEPAARPRPMRPPVDTAALTRAAAARTKAAAQGFADWTIRMGERIDIPARVARLELGDRLRAAGSRAMATAKKGAQAGAALSEKAASASADTARKGWKAAAVGDRMAAAGQAVRAQGEALSRTTQDALAQAADAGKKATSATGSAIKAQIRPDAPPPPPSGLEKLIGADVPAASGRSAAARVGRAAPSLPLFAEQDVPPVLPPVPDSDPAHDPAPDVPAPPRHALPPLLAGSPLPPQPQQPTALAAAPAAAARVEPAPARTPSPPRPQIDWAAQRARLRHFADERPWAMVAAAALLVGLVGYWVGAQFGRAGSTEAAAEEIGPAVRAYIMAHPEIIREAIQADQANQTAAAVEAVRSDVETPFSGAWAGNPDGDVTLTIFTDYACVFCRKSVPDVERLLRDDKGLKVVYREIPILSPASVEAARAALIAAKQGKYRSFHNTLFALGALDKAGIAASAAKVGVKLDDAALNDKGIDAELAKNMALAQQLGFQGTPSWIVGRRQLSGAVGYDQLKAAIADARSGGNG